jgi:hypothetical protein
MTPRAGEVAKLERLLETYRFTRPVPAEARSRILASKKRMLVNVLKTAGAFTALHGVFLYLYFAVKKTGIGLFTSKLVLAAAATATVSYGGYHAARYIAKHSALPKAPVVHEEAIPANGKEQYRWVDEIELYDGRKIRGAVISRGNTYEILSEGRIIRVPGKRIKSIKPYRSQE